MKKLYLLIAILLFLLPIVYSISSPSNPYILGIEIRNGESSINDVTVTVTNLKTEENLTSNTDEDGLVIFDLSNLNKRYTIGDDIEISYEFKGLKDSKVIVVENKGGDIISFNLKDTTNTKILLFNFLLIFLGLVSMLIGLIGILKYRKISKILLMILFFGFGLTLIAFAIIIQFNLLW